MPLLRITLPVLIYLILDFANPMMPGAVQLVDGSLQTVAGCQARSGETPEPAVLPIPRHLLLLVSRPEPIPPAFRHTASASPTGSVRPRTPLAPRSALASSPDDD
jgi:hypothetical protein